MHCVDGQPAAFGHYTVHNRGGRTPSSSEDQHVIYVTEIVLHFYFESIFQLFATRSAIVEEVDPFCFNQVWCVVLCRYY